MQNSSLKEKNLGHSGEEGFVKIPLSSEFGPFFLLVENREIHF